MVAILAARAVKIGCLDPHDKNWDKLSVRLKKSNPYDRPVFGSFLNVDQKVYYGVMTDVNSPIFTVGHSTHELESFIRLLRGHRITALADVRSRPFSRIPHFNREILATVLKTHGIKYLPLGKELGARRDEQECYVNGQAVYERVAILPLFRQGIDRVVEYARDNVIALMCSEKEPLDCHRSVLICRHLRPYRPRISHILADGGLEAHSETERRLMKMMGVSPVQGDLFADQEELIEQAYVARGKQIAFRVELQGVVE